MTTRPRGFAAWNPQAGSRELVNAVNKQGAFERKYLRGGHPDGQGICTVETKTGNTPISR